MLEKEQNPEASNNKEMEEFFIALQNVLVYFVDFQGFHKNVGKRIAGSNMKKLRRLSIRVILKVLNYKTYFSITFC